MFESWVRCADCGDDRDLSTPIRRRPCWRSWRGDGRAAGAAGRVGVSPPYDDLRATSQALRPARIALHGALDGRRVVVFGRDPLSVAAASAPDIMPRLARTVLAALDDLPAEDRALLLDTFGAWLDSGGSAEQTAASCSCSRTPCGTGSGTWRSGRGGPCPIRGGSPSPRSGPGRALASRGVVPQGARAYLLSSPERAHPTSAA